MKRLYLRNWPVVVFLALSMVVFSTTVWLSFSSKDAGQVSASLIGGPFSLVDGDGKSVTDADFKNAPYLVFFGFTHCPDICPTTMFDISQVFRALGREKKIKALFITVDPERDTPATLKDYTASFDTRIVGLSGPRTAIDNAIKAFRVYARKVPGSGEDYTYDHSAVVYLMDRQGRFVSAFNLQRTPEQAAQELMKYL